MTGENKKYKPFIATDREYLKKIAGAIKERGKLEEIKFYLLNDAISALGFDDDPYILLNPDDLRLDFIKPIVDKAFQKITAGVSEETKEKLVLLWDYLSEGDKLKKSDLILVFGGGGETRPKEAAKLYKEGWAPKILFTGQKGSYMKEVDITEAETFAQIAQKEGVPATDIIIEKESINTVENVTKSIELLKQISQLPKRIILIQIAYQMRRAYLTFKTASDWNPELIRYPAPSGRFRRKDYFTDKDGWGYIFNEYIKLYGARLMKHF